MIMAGFALNEIMRKILFLVGVGLLVAACGGRRMSDAELQHKIDSVKAVEALHQLQMQGITLEDANPLQVFYDSLAIQPLPLVFDKAYVEDAPNYLAIPQELAILMELDTGMVTRVISLPETITTRLLLELVNHTDEDCSLWLYSLDVDYTLVDKMMLYSTRWEQQFFGKGLNIGFSITTDYEIRLNRYTNDGKNAWEALYVLDESRHFVKVN